MSVSTKDLRALATLMRADPECDGAATMIEEAADEIDKLTTFVRDRVHCPHIRAHGGYHGRRLYLEAEQVVECFKNEKGGQS